MKLLEKIGADAEKFIERLEELFKTHPKVKEFHVTSDQQFFAEKNHADFHGKKLQDKSVETISRTDVAVIKQAAAAPAPAPETPAAPATPETPETPETPAPETSADEQAEDKKKEVENAN